MRAISYDATDVIRRSVMGDHYHVQIFRLLGVVDAIEILSRIISWLLCGDARRQSVTPYTLGRLDCHGIEANTGRGTEVFANDLKIVKVDCGNQSYFQRH